MNTATSTTRPAILDPDDVPRNGIDGEPAEWQAYLDTLTAPAAAGSSDRPPIVTLYGYWRRFGMDEYLSERFSEAGYQVHCVRTLADARLLPRPPAGHIHVRGDQGEESWFVIGGHRFAWRAFTALASATPEVQEAMGRYVDPGDDVDYFAAERASDVADRLLRAVLARAAA